MTAPTLSPRVRRKTRAARRWSHADNPHERCGRAWLPGQAWLVKAPTKVGLDADRLKAFAEHMGGRECAAWHRYLGRTWGDPARRRDVVLATKPIYAHFLLPAAEHLQTTAVRRPLLGEERLDAAPPQLLSLGLRGVRPIPVQRLGTAREPRLARYRWHRLDHREQRRDLVDIGGRHRRRQGDALGIRQHMVLAAGLAAMRELGPV